MLPGCVATPCVSSVSVKCGEVKDVGMAQWAINDLLWPSVNEVSVFVVLCYCFDWLFVTTRAMNNILLT